MKLGDMSFFALASRRMKWLGAKQQVISENIANADTPGFKSKQISGFDEMVGTSKAAVVATTSPGHLRGSASETAGYQVTVDDSAWEESIDGNTVVLEQQTIQAVEVSENYRLAAELYKKGHQLLTLAVTGIR